MAPHSSRWSQSSSQTQRVEKKDQELWGSQTLRDIYWLYDCRWHRKRKSDTTLYMAHFDKNAHWSYPCLQWQVLSQRCISINLRFVSITVHIPPQAKNNRADSPKMPPLPSLSPGSVYLLRVHLSSSAVNKHWLFKVSPDQQHQHHLGNLLEMQILRPHPRLPKSDSGGKDQHSVLSRSSEDSNAH